VALSVITGDPVWDGAGSLAIGVLLGCVAAVLAVEMKSLLIGESASPELERAIVTALESGRRCGGSSTCGPCTWARRACSSRPRSRSAGRTARRWLAAGIDAAERRVRSAVPIAEMIYLEPDIYRPGRADATDPAIRAVRRPRRPGDSP